jgi:hypothetical protein
LALKQCQFDGCGIWNHPGQQVCLHCHKRLPGLQCRRATCLKWNTAPASACSACSNALPNGPVEAPTFTAGNNLKRCPKAACGQWNWVSRRYCRLCYKSLPTRRCSRYGCGHWNYASTKYCLICRRPFVKGNGVTPTVIYPLPCDTCKTDEHASAECSDSWVVPQAEDDDDELLPKAITQFEVQWMEEEESLSSAANTQQHATPLTRPQETRQSSASASATREDVHFIRHIKPEAGDIPAPTGKLVIDES